MVFKKLINGIEALAIENEQLKVIIVPSLGGKILSIYNQSLQKEFLWTNNTIQLSVNGPGADYDSNFIGGIDELIPNDIPETIDSILYPDHGELWTTPLAYDITENKITVYGTLELSGLFYSKTLILDSDAPFIHLSYHIRNDAAEKRNFMWKLHAAVNIKAGDQLITSAKYAKVVDPEYSRFKKELAPFKWPMIENTDASLIPEKNNTVDFLYLFDTPVSEMELLTGKGQHLFSYSYDKKVFPFQWWFASYGGFLGHYTAILEPCTNMPISVNDAIGQGQSATLAPGSSLTTSVRIFAGETKNYIN